MAEGSEVREAKAAAGAVRPSASSQVDVSALGQRLTDRMKPSIYAYSYAVVSVVGLVASSGESVVELTSGDPPNQIAYPAVRFAETPTPLAPGDKVLLLWIGTNPVVLTKLVP